MKELCGCQPFPANNPDQRQTHPRTTQACARTVRREVWGFRLSSYSHLVHSATLSRLVETAIAVLVRGRGAVGGRGGAVSDRGQATREHAARCKHASAAAAAVGGLHVDAGGVIRVRQAGHSGS